MENASKALLIAGGMLFVILILTVGVFLFRKLGYQANYFYEDMSETEVFEFNQKFFNYDQKTDLRIQDVITLINLAKNANNLYKTPDKIEIYIDNSKQDLDIIDSEEIINKLKEDLAKDNRTKYSCSVEYADNNKSNFVGKIKITTMTP